MIVTEELSKTPVWAQQQVGGPPTGTETRSPEEAVGTPESSARCNLSWRLALPGVTTETRRRWQDLGCPSDRKPSRHTGLLAVIDLLTSWVTFTRDTDSDRSASGCVRYHV